MSYPRPDHAYVPSIHVVGACAACRAPEPGHANPGVVLDPCQECGKSTIFGSGRFVNRIDTGEKSSSGEDMYICPACDDRWNNEEHDAAYRDALAGDPIFCTHCGRAPQVPYLDWEITRSCECEAIVMRDGDISGCCCGSLKDLDDANICGSCRSGTHFTVFDVKY